MTFKVQPHCDYEVWVLVPCVIVQKSFSELTIATFFLAWGFAVDISW